MAKAKKRGAGKRGQATKSQAATVVFASKAGETLGSISLASSRIHRTPARIRQLMDLLDLPEGTDARLFARPTSVIVR